MKRGVPEVATLSTSLLHGAMRVLGVLVLMVGLWLGLNVVLEAWKLYVEPARIERFAQAIERGSNIDRTFAPSRSEVSDTMHQPGEEWQGEMPREGMAERVTVAPNGQNAHLRPSYFFAWVIVLVLLMVIGRLAVSAIRVGSDLALYDVQLRSFARTLVKETLSGKTKNSIRP